MATSLAQRIAKTRNAQSIGTDNLGGATVQTMQETTRSVLHRVSTFRNVSRQIAMESNISRIAEITSGVTVSLLAENTSIPAADATFAEVVMTAVKYGSRVVASNELLDDSDSTEALSEQTANALGFTEDTVCLAAIDSAVTNKTSAALATVTAANLGAVMSTVTATSNGTRQWLMNPETFGVVAGQLAGTAVYAGASNADFYLHGHPGRFVPAMNGPAATTGQTLALFGDFATGTYFGTRRLSVTVNTEISAMNDQSEIIGIDRFGFAVSNNEAQLLSALVAT